MWMQSEDAEPLDPSMERCVEFCWQGYSSVIVNEGYTNGQVQPVSTIVRINLETRREHVLRELHDINWFVQNSWPDKFRTWADIMEYE